MSRATRCATTPATDNSPLPRSCAMRPAVPLALIALVAYQVVLLVESWGSPTSNTTQQTPISFPTQRGRSQPEPTSPLPSPWRATSRAYEHRLPALPEDIRNCLQAPATTDLNMLHKLLVCQIVAWRLVSGRGCALRKVQPQSHLQAI